MMRKHKITYEGGVARIDIFTSQPRDVAVLIHQFARQITLMFKCETRTICSFQKKN